ncbi:hypothetical protein ACTFIW_005531 [Dictyostelium discoideum]
MLENLELPIEKETSGKSLSMILYDTINPSLTCVFNQLELYLLLISFYFLSLQPFWLVVILPPKIFPLKWVCQLQVRWEDGFTNHQIPKFTLRDGGFKNNQKFNKIGESLNDSKLFKIIASKPQNIDVATRSRSSVEKLYPAAVSDYRNNMGFVERNNKNTQMCIHSHKSYKWWFSIFNYLLRMFILNSYLMHKK